MPAKESITFSRIRIALISFFALTVGYLLFYLLVQLAGHFNQIYISFFSRARVADPVYFYPIIEQLVLGLSAIVFFVIGKKIYVPMLVYIGYAGKYYLTVFSFSSPHFLIIVLIKTLVPGLILTLGLKYGRKFVIMALFVNILLMEGFTYTTIQQANHPTAPQGKQPTIVNNIDFGH